MIHTINPFKSLAAHSLFACANYLITIKSVHIIWDHSKLEPQKRYIFIITRAVLFVIVTEDTAGQNVS